MTKFDVQTYFLPDEMSIDTFKTAVVSYGVSEDITDLYLKNYKRPFEGRDKNADNKWGILVDWDFTPNILNQSNGKVVGPKTGAIIPSIWNRKTGMEKESRMVRFIKVLNFRLEIINWSVNSKGAVTE